MVRWENSEIRDVIQWHILPRMVANLSSADVTLDADRQDSHLKAGTDITDLDLILMISDQCTYTCLHHNTPCYAFISHILTFVRFPDVLWLESGGDRTEPPGHVPPDTYPLTYTLWTLTPQTLTYNPRTYTPHTLKCPIFSCIMIVLISTAFILQGLHLSVMQGQ